MEIGDERIHAAEFTRGVDVDIGFRDVRVRQRGRVARQKRFDGPHARGADGDAPAGARAEECALGLDWKLVDLAVDRVCLNRRSLDRLKCAEPDVQSDLCCRDSPVGKGVEKLWCKVKAGSWRSDRDLTCGVGVNGLVAGDVECALGLGAMAGDVRGQRDFAEPVGDVGDRLASLGGELHEGRTVLALLTDSGGKCARWMREGCPNGQFFSGADEAPPSVAVGSEKKALHLPACGALRAKAGGQD